MGYFSLDFRKAKGASDSRMSDHIERRVIAPNVDPMRTHLNRELVRMPEGIRERDDAIAARISSAGIRRKITHDQVRAIRVMLSGTHEDMMEIEKAGRLDDWCRDSMDWLYRTFGRENVVSAVLHMDEHTPHIHATLVPIVTGERRKAGQKKPQEGGRTYRKKANAARLCADDVLNRTRLIAYHDDYARVMVKYGLQRGIRGSEARHVSTAQYYRDLRRQTDELEENVRQLKPSRKRRKNGWKRPERKSTRKKLEAVKMEAKTAIIAKMGSLFGQWENQGGWRRTTAGLQNEIAAREESIEDLQASLQRQRAQYGRELATVQTDYIQKLEREKERTAYLQKWTERACGWFPLFADAMRMERYCRSAGFTPEQTDRLFTFQPLEYSGNLYSEEHKRALSVTGATAQMGIEQEREGNALSCASTGRTSSTGSGSSSRGCSDGYDQRYSNRNGKTRDSNCNDYKYLCANIKNAGNIIALSAFFIFLHLKRGNSLQDI